MRRRRTVAILAVVLVATLAGAANVMRLRNDARAFCAHARLQYEYDPRRVLSTNSYADVDERLCVTSRRDARQLVDVRFRVTVQINVDRDLPLFEPDTTWADVEVTVDGRVTAHRCDFPELSRMTPWKLENGVIGHAGVLPKDCRFAVPRGDRVTARMTFHAVEVSGPHREVSSPVVVRRHGDSATCTIADDRRTCGRAEL